MKYPNRALQATLWTAIAALGLAACANPMRRDAEEALREKLLSSHRFYQDAIKDAPKVELARTPSDVEERLTQAGRVTELDRMSGPTAYENDPLQLGTDLQGEEKATTVSITLQKSVELAVRNNLNVQIARLAPAAQETLVTQAQAVFDAVFFSNFDFSHLDTPGGPALPLGSGGNRASDVSTLSTGIRKPLSTGGSARVQTDISRTDNDPNQTRWDPIYSSSVLVGITQPLLRNFGKDATEAPLELALNAKRASMLDLHNSLLDTVLDVESKYWDLVQSRQRLLIQLRLLKRTMEDRDRLEKREQFDVSPVRITEANSFVELRRAEVIRSRNLVRVASDRLKVAINAPELPVSSEALLLPVDVPADLPVEFNLLDAVTTALRRRPDVRRSLISIDDASIRQRLADNQTLPKLDVELATRFNGLSNDGVADSYDTTSDGRFIDYLASLQFEMPIGNRQAQAALEQRRLERSASVIGYQRSVQTAIVEVKEALRELLTTYELIGATRAARRAAADSLRAIEEQEKAGVALTPEFLLDLKLSTQQRLADAEVQEIEAMTAYNLSLAKLYRTMGTLLENNNVRLAEDQTN
ncbi:MAG: TolC family protein [Phycisphaeraceae bacterium]|nr:TolC family protein [Phycisphaeraceae bacterium]